MNQLQRTRLTATHVMRLRPARTESVTWIGECLFTQYTVKGRRRIVNKNVAISFEALALFSVCFVRCML